jgi:hypothetical protein
MQLPLLALYLCCECCIVLLQFLETPNVGTIGRSHKVGEHVHVAEHAYDDVFLCERMRKYGPIGAGDIALLEGLIPKVKESGRFSCFGVPDNVAPVSTVERFLKKLCTAGALAGYHDRHTMKIMVGCFLRSGDSELSQNTPQLNSGEAGPDYRAVQLGSKAPNAPSTGTLRRGALRYWNLACIAA